MWDEVSYEEESRVWRNEKRRRINRKNKSNLYFLPGDVELRQVALLEYFWMPHGIICKRCMDILLGRYRQQLSFY